MIKAKQSEYLLQCKPQLKQLIDILKNDFEYVSVLATDVTGTSYSVNQKTTSVNQFSDSERGFVVRVYKNGGYSEYSFNKIEDVNRLAEEIRTALNSQSEVLNGIRKLRTPLLEEEEVQREFAGDVSEE
ncbi:MAG: hypothetical protein IIY33_02270, partial [Erysipelotrichaceae bacterium]|nr:hypothetical protein [Erysipelotrichaceae bacterium]